jgi:hypothetical protein
MAPGLAPIDDLLARADAACAESRKLVLALRLQRELAISAMRALTLDINAIDHAVPHAWRRRRPNS